jgi:hypothetical protein
MKKSIFLLGGIGIGAGVLYALKRAIGTAGSENRGSTNGKKIDGNGKDVQDHADLAAKSEPQIDDRGTGQEEAAQILKSVRDAAFDASDEKLALALGRPTEEIEAWTAGSGDIDGDVVMKARTLAINRGVEIQ